jgi:mono/diheme cytochrome c family protein
MKRIVIAGAILAGLCASGWTQVQRGDKQPGSEVPLINSIQGPDLYKAYCASCHGIDARGGGPMAKSLRVRPSDLTRIAAHSGGTFPEERVKRIIAGEDALPAGHGSHEMPVWGPIFSKVEADRDYGLVRIDNLAQYLKQLQKR